jgi:hypothetical protein
LASGKLQPPVCGSPLLILDAHVHIYPCFDLPEFFAAAFSNCLYVARNVGYDRSHIPVLLLTEGRRERVFRDIQEEIKKGNNRIGDDQTAGYRVFATEEDGSLRVQKGDGTFLFLVAGRQIVTSEQLEVLALSTVSEIPDGLSLEKTVAAVEKDRAVPVIPWGFGKWYGRRRRVLMQYLASRREGVFFLGDNGGRPSFLRFPDFQRMAPGASFKVLPGSDVLPLRSELKNVGSFGFTLQEKLDLRRPGGALKQILSNPGVVPMPYGSPESITRFARNQIALRIWKHRI